MNPIISLSYVGMVVFAALNPPFASAQDSAVNALQSGNDSASSGFIVGHPFSATKYARRVKVSPDGKEQFIANDRYPLRIARDENGRIMMQHVPEDLLSECGRLEQLEPPPCPVEGYFVIDPEAQTDTHWLEGERATSSAVTMPLRQDQLEEAARDTSEVPDIPPDVDSDASTVTAKDLGDKTIDGVTAHGVRTTVVYPAGHAANKVPITWIHEVWIAPEMKLVVRVVEGDPQGEETIWGLEKISLHPGSELFQPPEAYETQHRKTSVPWSENDFKTLQSWFVK
jgi:hypothetical protein